MTNNEQKVNKGNVGDVVTTREEVQKVQEENNEIEMIDNIEVLKEEISYVEKLISGVKYFSYLLLIPLSFLAEKLLEYNNLISGLYKVLIVIFVFVIAFTWTIINVISFRWRTKEYKSTILYYNSKLKRLSNIFKEMIKYTVIMFESVVIVYAFLLVSVFFPASSDYMKMWISMFFVFGPMLFLYFLTTNLEVKKNKQTKE